MTALDITTLKRAPEFHLDQLLELLATVPDGFTTERTEVWVSGRQEAGWDVTAGGYFIGVQPEYRCGFAEEGDGKVLTALLGRLAETKGQVSISTTPQFADSPPAGLEPYFYVGWRVGVKLGENCSRANNAGVAFGDMPGTTLLVAYLRAWGVIQA